ncbi:hypothetical protein A9995_10840 [Erythrobacter sp. QSSC1-22B]|uniref:mechanosensitive ion channel domain-containing protein n=1 Tax=Erythrobacter sp. QSSC1-22B TaxID=1860125 RepID=UPI0008056CE9|nr:mechanosensitive ion channel domain-containing protein [Erythrobacter sp. QSSC1-22B]OBX18468.1 hypothetical protein A9995_10840 [Erythrobacter sp. QSSC1-22B]
MNSTIFEQLYSSDALASAVLVIFLLTLRLVAGHALKGRENLTPQVVRRWTANVRNLLLLIGVLGLILIWAPQLRTFALSLTAVAVALVVATKELILCLSGSAFRTFTRAYSVGDHVELGGIRGEVLDYNLLATRLQEFENRDGSFVTTGRAVIIPHSLLFTSPSRVDGEAGGRVRHVFQLTFEPVVNLFAERVSLEEIASEAQRRCEEICKEHLHLSNSKPGQGVDFPAVQVGLATTDIGKTRLQVTTFALPDVVSETENAIACALGDQIHRWIDEKTTAQSNAPS